MKIRLQIILLFLFPLVSCSQSTITIKYPQSAIVAPLKMNVFYVGIDNPLVINYEGKKSFLLKSSVGSLKENGNEYAISFTKPGTCTLTLLDMNGKNEIQYQFRVKSLPQPTPTLSSKWKDGDILDKNILLAGVLIPILEGFDFELFYGVTSFSVFISTATGELEKFNNNGAKFSEELLSHFRELKSADKVLFYKIKCKKANSDEEISLNEPLEITVK
jgi:hypothetical protein